MDGSRGHWFITGATGFIGRELIRRLLTRTDDRITLLLRPSRGLRAEQRATALLASLGLGDTGYRTRVLAVAGDVRESGLGLSAAARRQVLAHDTRIIHLAADTRFHNTLECARASNVQGVRNVLSLARELKGRGRLQTLVHVSTAYVAGARTDVVGGEDLRPLGPFRNTYERSKCEAEQLLRQHMADLPVVVFRPSIVVGDSRNGDAIGSNTIYWALKQYLRGRRVFFARTDTPLDIVPVDYVADAMLHLAARDTCHGRTIPLVAGAGSELALGDLATSVGEYFSRPAPWLLPPPLLTRSRTVLRLLARTRGQRRFVDNMLSYLPYFSANPRFDASDTRELLAGSGIEPPRVHDYLCNLLSFCAHEGWAGECRSNRLLGQARAVLSSCFATATGRLNACMQALRDDPIARLCARNWVPATRSVRLVPPRRPDA